MKTLIGTTAVSLVLGAMPILAQEQLSDEVFDLGVLVLEGERLRRTQDEVPPSTTVISGPELDSPQNTDLLEVISRTPNVVANEGSILLPAIRGIDGSGGAEVAITAGGQPRIPILIDDVARPAFNSALISRSSLWDTSSVEVAVGPQSTSTGRNAVGGTVRVYTNDPSFDREFALRFGALETNSQTTLSSALMLNTPIVEDQLAFRFTAENSDGTSFVRVVDPAPLRFDPNEEAYSRYRAKLLYTPLSIPGAEFLLSYDTIDTQGPLAGHISGDPDDLTIATFTTNSAYEINEQNTMLARAIVPLSNNVTVNARASRLENSLLFPDVDTGFGSIDVEQKEDEVEVFLLFNDIGILKQGVIGLIYNEATERQRTSLDLYSVDGEIENRALYTELEFDVDSVLGTNGLTLIAGGRYEVDDRVRNVATAGGVPIASSDLSVEEFLPKFGLRYEARDNLTLGYTYSEGFRPGGVDVDLLAPLFGAPTVVTSLFGPEFLKQHEIYARGRAFDDRVGFTATAFHYTYEDAQVQGASATIDSFGVNQFGNVPEAIGRGIELSFDADVGSGFTLFGSAGYLDTEITDPGATLAAFQGASLPRAPKRTATLGLSYEGRKFDARATVNFVNSQTSALGQPIIDSSTIVDVSGGYDFEIGNTDARLDLFVTNLFDARDLTRLDAAGTPFSQTAVIRPRTIGFTVTTRF